MTIAVAEIAPVASARAWFWGSLIAVTASPLVLIPLALSTGATVALDQLIALATVGHVASTLHLFRDRGFRPMIRQRWPYMVAIPLALTIALLSVVAAFPVLMPSVLLVFSTWQLYHVQRQSFGIAMFASRTAKVKPLTLLPLALYMTVAAAILGIVASQASPTLPRATDPALLRAAAVAIYVAAIALFAFDLVRREDVRRSPLTLFVTSVAVLFLLPTLVPAGPYVVLFSYGIAHGAQYLIFMATLAARSEARLSGLAALVAAVALFGLFLQVASQFLAMVMVGASCWHFMVDARVWKTRDPLSPVAHRFSFVLR